MDIKTFYLSDDFLPVWEKFIAIQAKKGKTRSQIICELIKEFVDKNQVG
jgi:macrodomain Ter protein organizer (MatP/YcbG family)